MEARLVSKVNAAWKARERRLTAMMMGEARVSDPAHLTSCIDVLLQLTAVSKGKWTVWVVRWGRAARLDPAKLLVGERHGRQTDGKEKELG